MPSVRQWTAHMESHMHTHTHTEDEELPSVLSAISWCTPQLGPSLKPPPPQPYNPLGVKKVTWMKMVGVFWHVRAAPEQCCILWCDPCAWLRGCQLSHTNPCHCNRTPCSWTGRSNEMPLSRGVTDPLKPYQLTTTQILRLASFHFHRGFSSKHHIWTIRHN